MGRLIFVDTSAWIGSFVEQDQHSEEAVQAMEELLGAGRSLVTTDYIFDETVTRVRYQGGYDESVEVGERILTSGAVRLVEIGRELRDEAWKVFKKFRDQKVSFTDCASFATMKRYSIDEAFTFDSDFRKAGFTVVPAPKGK